eukprot:s8323_g3.t1
MRKWLLRAQELKDADPPFETPQHCREVLKNKSMTLFAEMLAEADYPDKTLVRSLTPDVRAAILQTSIKGSDSEIAHAVHQLTLEERDKGWLRGPIDLPSVPGNSVITRRFGIKQNSSDATKGKDSYLAVLNPLTSTFEIFQSLVLPFGARPAVQGFYRVAAALWYLALFFFDLHWTQFYDDYFLVAGERESQHVDLIQTSFFTLLGWETASEKDFGFGFVTRALGVQIDLSDCHIGLVKICNTMSRRQELEQLIDEILSSPSVSGSVLTSLRGRLQFCDNQIFGRLASLKLKVLSSYCDRKSRVRVDAALKEALAFLKEHVVQGPDRVVHCAFRNCFHVYSDASFESNGGGVGALAYNANGLLLSWFGEELSNDVMLPLMLA